MVQAVARRVLFARALRSRRFALLWSGQTVSAIGDGAFFTALAWQVLVLTGSAGAMGATLVAQSIPMVLFMLVGGVVADRLPRRLTLLWSDGGRAAVTLVVAALGFMHLLAFWHLIVLAALFGLAEAFFRPAIQSIPPELVPVDDLPSANALFSFGRNVTTLIGPAIGAAFISVTSTAGAFAFDGLTFVISAICLLLMGRIDRPKPAYTHEGEVANAIASPSVAVLPGAQFEPLVTEQETPSGRGWRGVFTDIREGIGYITGSTWLWLTIALASLGNIAWSPFFVSLPRLIHTTYHQGVWLLSAILTSFAVGSILATVVVGQFKRIRWRGVTAYLSLIVSSVGLTLFGVSVDARYIVALLLVCGALMGAGLAVFEIIWATTMQEMVPPEKLGRVVSVDWLGSLCLQPIGFALVGALTDRLGPSWVFLGAGFVSLALSLIGLASRNVRALD